MREVWMHYWTNAMNVAHMHGNAGRRCRVSASHGRSGPNGQRWLVQLGEAVRHG